MEELIPLAAIISLFVVLPAMILHHVTQWKKGRSISTDDEQLLDDLYHISQRLDDRIQSIERIMDVDNPDWRRLADRRDETDMLDQKIEDRERNTNIRRVS
ncbi:envelope stress response membrane protein PspB [Pacificimonas flava]|uniref:Envelope stress response membrane protein PspB n=2 Tax=Pacificimonas TaxID=1960290 RepID=A0A219B140_9SPHN|nr:MULTISPECIES: envelope stress response membrane protein PspB [Pacificimonas]MBZ6380076.1 envelope stress response membrane protein PspB [Pacificimonas aurantium]OWV32040.1 envelope stress response membrane protein PspB [Pacificimonas flava]